MAEGYQEIYDNVSGYRLKKYVNETLSFVNGAATFTHNIGTSDYFVIIIPYGGLIPRSIINENINTTTIRIAHISQNDVDDSPVKTNYTGTFQLTMIIFYK